MYWFLCCMAIGKTLCTPRVTLKEPVASQGQAGKARRFLLGGEGWGQRGGSRGLDLGRHSPAYVLPSGPYPSWA